MKKIFILSLFVFFILSFGFVLAADSSNSSGIVPCGSGSSTGNACTICHLIVGIHNLVNWGLKILIVVTLVCIAFAGIMYMVSTGSEQMMSSAKNFLSASLMGFAIVLGAWLIVSTIMWLIASSSSMVQVKSWNSFECSTKSSAGNTESENNTNAGDSQKLAECNKWCNDNKATENTSDAEKYNADCLKGCSDQFSPGGNPDPAGNSMSQADAQKQLDSCGVSYSNANTLYGVQDVSVKEMCNFKSSSGCDTYITSGTSGVHATGSSCTHSNGCKFDFKPTSCNDTWIKNNYTNTGTRSDGAACYSAPSGACYAREGNHWDMSTTRSCKAQGC